MIGILRAAFFGLIGLTILYFLVSIYSRSVRRERLEKAWDGDPANEGAAPGARDAHMETGMEAYRRSLRRRLLLLIFVVPIILVGVTIYVVNVQ